MLGRVTSRLTQRVLNRTLLQRQHLLRRTSMSALEMTEHLVGLQAQNTLPPYLSLWSRLEDFRATELSELLAEPKAVRILLMRGTIHLVSAADSLELRPLVQAMLDKQTGTTPFGRHTADIEYDDLAAAGRAALDDGALTPKALGLTLAQRYPGHDAGHLSNTVRTMLPLVQLPPRGMWKQSAGQNYQTAQTWLGGCSTVHAAGRARDGPPLPPRVRSGHGGRCDDVVADHRDPQGAGDWRR